MAQDVRTRNTGKELSDWFLNEVEEYTQYVAQLDLKILAGRIKDLGNSIERKIFKYIATRLMNRENPPSAIDGLPYRSPTWKPLSENYIKRKKHKRKWMKTGSLIAYLQARDGNEWFHGGPKVRVDKSNYVITYESMFNNGRREFGAGRQEQKLYYNEDARPVLEPMEDFLFDEKLNYEIDKLLEKWTEENYG